MRVSVTRLLICLVFMLFTLSVPALADQRFQLVTQRTYGVEPAAVKYSEYENNDRTVSVMMIDPKQFDFSVVFANPPLTVGQFHDRSPNVLLTVNGGYWDRNYRPTDLCVAEGRIIKAANTRNKHFGLFVVAQDGAVTITDIADVPLSSIDLTGLRHALKSGPHLIRKGQPLKFKANSSHARTVIATNVQGDVLFVVNKAGTMTYSEMTAFLISTGLDITDAFNLDGGRSAGFVLGKGANTVQKDSWEVADVIQVIGKMGK
jgi:uncharacterized protein YigE (DUF2233 family)